MNIENNKKLSDIAISVLDLATIRQGNTAADAFRKTLELAQQAENWQYKRFWVAEHHNMQSIASSATSVLIGYIAGGTSKIRVGSGGIMLPNHAPLIIAEQFGTLESLYPGRIDLGLGRAPGTDQVTAMALRRDQVGAGKDFPAHVEELRTYLSAENASSRVRAVPGEGLEIPIWLLGSSTYSAQLAAALGLPFAFASHFSPANLHMALNVYRDNFTPSESLDSPYVIACVNVIAADSEAEAESLATSFKLFALDVIRGIRKPLQPPIESMDGRWNPAEEAAVDQMMYYSFIGESETLEKSLQRFLDETQVDEIMVASHIFDHTAKLSSYRILADIMQSEAKPLNYKG